jgi:hypothetical protein
MVGFGFHEVMEGSIERIGERFDRPFRFEVAVSTPKLIARVAMCDAEGFLRIDGFAKNARATGRLEMSPLIERRIRYVLDFTADDGKRYQFDGSKTGLRGFGPKLLKNWTTLPGVVTDERGSVWGRAVLRFHMRRDLKQLVSSMWVRPSNQLKEVHA